MVLSGFLVAALITVGLYLPHVRAAEFVYQDRFSATPPVVHGLSLALHVLNGALLCRLAQRLAWPAPAAVAGLFLIHPLNIEAVAYGAAQSELLILASVLLIGWAVVEGWWWAGVVPLVALLSTKVHSFWLVLTQPDVGTAVAQGVSYLTWWRWEATAVGRHLRSWLLPFWLTNDHDVVHGAVWPLALLALLLPLAGWAAWGDRVRLTALVWMALVLLPRFLVRVPLSPLNEHHWYPVTAGLSLFTVSLLQERRA